MLREVKEKPHLDILVLRWGRFWSYSGGEVGQVLQELLSLSLWLDNYFNSWYGHLGFICVLVNSLDK